MGLVAPQHVRSVRIRDWACVSCAGRQILYLWATREALNLHFICEKLRNIWARLACTRPLKAIHLFSEETRADTKIGSTFFLPENTFPRPWMGHFASSLLCVLWDKERSLTTSKRALYRETPRNVFLNREYSYSSYRFTKNEYRGSHTPPQTTPPPPATISPISNILH